jgi:putative ABC transport system permease protein
VSVSSIRALGRVAERDIRRHRGRSALVVLLILLPVAAMVGAVAIIRTTSPSQERHDVARMGRADLLAQGVSESVLWTYLPDGSTIEPLAWADGAQIVLPGSKPSISLRGMVLDGLSQGMLTLTEGRPPTGVHEVAISPATATLAGVGLGGQITLEGSSPATVVGMVENELSLGERAVVVDPVALPLGSKEFESWLVALPPGSDPDAIVNATIDPETGAQNVIIQSRASGRLGIIGGDGSSQFLVLGSLALVEAALVASAAFAVSIRRRQRELGLLAATGATPGQLAGTVVAEAAILGLVATVAGVLVGITGSLALTPWLDELTQRRNPPLLVDIGALVGPAVIGFVAAMIAAIVPARTVSRVPVLVSLSGRRPPEAPARRSLRIGLAAVALSVGMTLLGANLRLNGSETVSLVLMIGGAVLGTLGFGACGPWLLERLEGVAVRLPLASRIAFRDTARARSRSSPIVTAVLASFAATVALGTWTVSRDAANAAEWRPYLYPEQLILRGAGAEAAAAEVAQLEGAINSTPTTVLRIPAPGWFSIEAPDARDANGNVIKFGEEPYQVPFQFQELSVGTPGTLAIAHAESAASDLAAGKLIVLWHEPVVLDEVEIVLWDDPEAPAPTRRVRMPATVIVSQTGGGIRGGLIHESAAEELGFEPWPETDYIITFDRHVTEADVAMAAEIAGTYPDTFADASFAPQRPDESFRVLLIALALLFALSVTGVAIALGEAESRPEQRSLLALGAEPRLRRRIAAARAGVLALLAGILAVPAGLLPVWGLLASREAPFVVPLLEVVGAVAALPLLAIVGAWLLSRPIPDWGALRSVGAGQ